MGYLRVCILRVGLSQLPGHCEVGGFAPSHLHSDGQPHLRPSVMGPVDPRQKPLNGKQKYIFYP